MKIYIGDSVVDFNKKKYKKIGDSTTSEVYQYGNKVLKFFKNKTNNEEFNIYMRDCNLKLNVTYLLIDLMYNRNYNFIGTVANYVNGISDFNNYYQLLLRMQKNEFMENFYKTSDDLNVLSKYGIAAYDLSVTNNIFNDGVLYHVDYGNFERSDDASNRNICVLNLYMYDVLSELFIKEANEIPIELTKVENYLEFLEKNMNESEMVESFVKKFDCK